MGLCAPCPIYHTLSHGKFGILVPNPCVPFSRWPALVLEDDVTFAPLLELPGGRRAVSATLVDAEAGGARWGVLQLG